MALLLLSSTLLLSLFAPQIGANSQSEALSRIYQAKWSKSGIDTSEFTVDNAKWVGGPYAYEHGTKEKDEIAKLEGQPRPVKFKQYGGYIPVDPSTGKAFYYYFVEARKSRKQLPLVLWLNGGPGCSSLGYGAMQELGPFRVHSDGKTLFENPFAWNRAANVLFLESPAGVGFSYSNSTSDYIVGGDKQTAMDNYRFLLNWLERFPEYKNTDFYIAGESYAGHYVPQLAHTVLYHNLKAKKNIINLKGIIIGNAAINDETDLKGMYEYFGSHALVSDDTLDQILKYCKFGPDTTAQSQYCQAAAIEVSKNIDPINIYNIYAPNCLNSNLTNKPKKASVKAADPCSENYVTAYLNRLDVQKSLHANVTNIPYPWKGCSRVIKKWQDSPSSVLPLLKEFLSNGLRVWIFSGDIDGRVPVTSTQLSIKTMKLPVNISWYPWYIDEQVGGYTQIHEGNLTFATVRGAGHQVPTYQPAASLSLFVHFLQGKPLPKS